MFLHRTQGHYHLPLPERALLARQRASGLVVAAVVYSLLAGGCVWLVIRLAPRLALLLAVPGAVGFTIAAFCTLYDWYNAREYALLLEAKMDAHIYRLSPRATRLLRGLGVDDDAVL